MNESSSVYGTVTKYLWLALTELMTSVGKVITLINLSSNASSLSSYSFRIIPTFISILYTYSFELLDPN